jgi:hypothetical protein
MTIRYRTSGAWGAGVGANLEPAHVDENFYTIDQRVVDIEALPPPAPGIDHFVINGDQMTVVMEDNTTRGPYTLPVVTLNFRGTWAPTTAYLAGDIFSQGQSIYIALVNHTSAGTFDPGATDGLGNDLYGFGLTVEGTLPAGGAVGQILTKATAVDYEVEWSDPAIASGGTTGQVLAKASNTDFDTAWVTPDSGGNIADAPDVEVGTLEGGDVLRWDSNDGEWKKTKEFPYQTHSGTTLTLVNANLYAFHNMTAGGGCIVTVPPAANWGGTMLVAGALMHFRQSTTGPLEFVAGAGVTIDGVLGMANATDRRGAVATLYYVGGNVWVLYGLLAEESSA